MASWRLDEVAFAGRENLDPEHVARYDAKAWPELIRDEAVLLRGLGLHDSATLVDFGAGTGELAVMVASDCRMVVAVDPSPVMRAALQAKVRAAGVRNVECVDDGFLSCAPESPAEFVYSRHALHHVPDAWKAVALSRVAAMLVPGGIFRLRDIVYHFDAAEFDDRIEAWVAGAAGSVDTGWTRAELEEHVRDEHSTFTWLLEPMIERAGLEIRSAEYSESGIFAGYVCVKPPW